MTIVNYGSGGAITGCNDCLGGEDTTQGANTARFEQMTFIRTSKRILWTQTEKEIFWDLDGTLGGVANTMLTKYRAYNNWPECDRLDENIYDDTSRCAIIRRIAIDKVIPSQLSFTDITIQSSVGSDNLYFLPLDIYGWVIPMANNHEYSFKWSVSGSSAYQYRLTYSRNPYLLEAIENNGITSDNDKILINFSPNPSDYIPYSYDVNYASMWSLSSINNTVLSDMADSKYYNNTMSTLLTTKNAKISTSTYTNENPFIMSVYAHNCPPEGCYIPPAPELGPPMLWSNTTAWPSKTLPIKSQDVYILNTMWIVLDITPPDLGCVYVYGKLSFQNEIGVNIALNLKCLVIYGTVEIIGENNTSYNGDLATINVYGKIGASLPIKVSNDVFVGSKVIAVMGSFIAKGKPTSVTWARLVNTAAGTNSIILNETVSWAVGDEIILSNTAYYNNVGNSILELSNDAAIDTQIISTISTSGGRTTITITGTLKQSHLCHVEYNEVFCGYVGLLTRSILIKSSDSEDTSSTSYGFGAHIVFVDLARPKQTPNHQIGQGIFEYVHFQNLGKINSDHFGIGYLYKTYATTGLVNSIHGCSFSNIYNFMIRASGIKNLVVTESICSRSIGGGIFIDDTNSGVMIHDNLIMNVYNIPATLLSTYAWNRPISSFFITAGDTLVYNNVAAGSVDSGFYIGQQSFINRVSATVCASTHGTAYTLPTTTTLETGKSVWDNEAVGCQVGVTLVTVTASDASGNDCAVMIGFKVWRNAHAGILSADTQANVLITHSTLAENHIGMSLNFYKNNEDAFSGIINSKVIGLFTNKIDTSQTCGYTDCNWGKSCRAFWETDPLALQDACHSALLNTKFKRVGVMLPQFLNAPRTCATAGRFDVCEPPTTIDRLCALPFNNRYGLPMNMQYPEQHISNTLFGGFSLSSCSTQQSAAVALNPLQIDQQPAIFMSNILWKSIDTLAKFGFRNATDSAQMCTSKPCAGTSLIIVHDLDGSVRSKSPVVTGQILFNNPGYIAPSPQCSADTSLLGSGFYFCTNAATTSVPTPFIQYNALWRDNGPQVLEPLMVTRSFGNNDNRTYAAFGPISEMCSKRMFYSRYPFLIAQGMKNRIRPTGQTPSSWIIRWDAPSVNNVAILEFFIASSLAINVYVGVSEKDSNFQFMKSLSTLPTLSDPAGSNARNPQARTLTVTIRGGTHRYYKFVEIPVVQVTIRMQMALNMFYKDRFIANIALLLQIDASRIKIANVQTPSGSSSSMLSSAFHSYDHHHHDHHHDHQSIDLEATTTTSEAGIYTIAFTVSPTDTNGTAPVKDQITELQGINQALTSMIYSGFAAPVLDSTQIISTDIIQPVVPVEFNSSYVITNSSDEAAYRNSIIAQSASVSMSLSYVPTSEPTLAPNTIPTIPTTAAPSISFSPTTPPVQSNSMSMSKAALSLIIAFSTFCFVVLVAMMIWYHYKRSKDNNTSSAPSETLATKLIDEESRKAAYRLSIHDPKAGAIVYDKSKQELRATGIMNTGLVGRMSEYLRSSSPRNSEVSGTSSARVDYDVYNNSRNNNGMNSSQMNNPDNNNSNTMSSTSNNNKSSPRLSFDNIFNNSRNNNTTNTANINNSIDDTSRQTLAHVHQINQQFSQDTLSPMAEAYVSPRVDMNEIYENPGGKNSPTGRDRDSVVGSNKNSNFHARLVENMTKAKKLNELNK